MLPPYLSRHFETADLYYIFKLIPKTNIICYASFKKPLLRLFVVNYIIADKKAKRKICDDKHSGHFPGRQISFTIKELKN